MLSVPASLAVVAPLQSAAITKSSSGVDMSMGNIEIMLKHLLKNTKAEICCETADLVATHFSPLSSEMASERSELAVESDERNAESDVIVSRVHVVILRTDALE